MALVGFGNYFPRDALDAAAAGVYDQRILCGSLVPVDAEGRCPWGVVLAHILKEKLTDDALRPADLTELTELLPNADVFRVLSAHEYMQLEEAFERFICHFDNGHMSDVRAALLNTRWEV